MSSHLLLRPLRHHDSTLLTQSTTISSGPSQASRREKYRADQNQVTIGMLPDDVLVEIFFFYVDVWATGSTKWHTLIHVCQRWRHVVFAYPHHLNLRLVYTGTRPISEMLDVWPVLPVAIIQQLAYTFSKPSLDRTWGNIATALESEHRTRICEINLNPIPTPHWERFAAAMQKPFPELTFLYIWREKNNVTFLPDPFLGGSAPLLQVLWLGNCAFPGLPKLRLSSNHFVALFLWDIPHSGYLSPTALCTVLSVMSRLETLYVGFQSPLSRPDPASRPPPLLTRSVLPALTKIVFRGVHEYLEDLLAHIEAPSLNRLEITFFMNFDFVVPQLHQLISRAESFKTFEKAFVYTSHHAIRFVIFRETPQFPSLSLEIKCTQLDRQLSSLAQVCSSSLHLLSTLVQLDVVDPVPPNPQSYWTDGVETTQWMELLQPFTAVKDLRLDNQVGLHVCCALEALAKERVTEVLPALQNIFLGDLQSWISVPKSIERFTAARQLSGRPVAVYPWIYREIYERVLLAFSQD
ncbi:hypothetical protein F5148DRAFT_484998 [Russula earlei]|uniref:Uncharacterized protein n=1 Tax=Russula earlei TaxID=71964 RepID=A0ACC0TXU5_9AGAM|nr:hypothetical protein F5148DRAFT_484998 [Russula earlei]